MYNEGVTKDNDGVVILKVAAKSMPNRVAGAITKYMEEGFCVALLAMGAGAVNQAMKALATARGMAAPHGWNLACIPAFKKELADGVEKTAMKFIVIKQK
jgi:stage V sporulation protein S